MATNGEFKNEKWWISREDFSRLKDTDPYAAMCFSFGNNLKGYAYAKEIEPWKKAVHHARAFGDCTLLEAFRVKSNGDRADIRQNKEEYKKAYIKWYMKNIMKSDKEYHIEKTELERNIKEESERLRNYLVNARNKAGVKSSDVDRHLGTNGMSGHYFGKSQWEFPTRENYIKMQEIMPDLSKPYDEVVGLSSLWQSLERLESLERLQRLQSLQSLESLESTNLSYEQVEIETDSVVYCDIPYKNTDGYKTEFDHDKFYEWALKQPFRIYVSEYDMPKEFTVCSKWEKRVTLSSNNRAKAKEKLFCNKSDTKVKQWTQGSLFSCLSLA